MSGRDLWHSSLNSCIWTKKLSPSLFQNLSPDFCWPVSFSEDTGITSHRQKLIDYDWSKNPVDMKDHKVNTSIVAFLGHKQFFYLLWIFSQGAYKSEKVTIAECPLSNIEGRDILLEQNGRFMNFWSSFPSNVIVGKVGILTSFVNRFWVWLKVWICPLLLFLNNGSYKSDRLLNLLVGLACR